jgi:hypothetical protein
MTSEQAFAASKDTLRAWRNAEKAAMARIGLRYRRKDDYEIWLDPAKEWEGGVALPKRSGGPGEVVAFLDPPLFSVGHVPTEELIEKLKNPGRELALPVTLPGHHSEVIPDDLDREVTHLSIWQPSQVAPAVDTVAAAITEYVLPWMKANASLQRLRTIFSEPGGNPGDEARRLERLAVINLHLGDMAATTAALDEYHNKCCATGIAAIDESRLRFVAGIRERQSG